MDNMMTRVNCKPSTSERIGATICAVLFSGLVSFCVLLSLYRSSADQPSLFGQKLSQFAAQVGLGSSITTNLEMLHIKTLVVPAIVFIVLLSIAASLFRGHNKLIRFCYHNRYWIALAVLCVSVLFRLNGTNLFAWNGYLNGSEPYAPLFGNVRGIRSDEWSTWSVFTISQGLSGWPAVNPSIAGGNISTLWISVGGIPALNPAVLLKPLYWGFLLLGTERGFSVLWVLRFLLLFLVSFEFAMRYTERKPWLSFAAAMMITFAPYVQWWYSQSIAEVLIFGQGMLLCLDFYLNANSRKTRIWIAILLAYCIGCYVMIAYASWLISTFYVILALAIVLLIRNRKRLTKADIPTLLLPVLLVIVYLAVIALSDSKTLSSVLHSAYPGARLVTGGTLFQTENYFTGLYALLLPFFPAPFSNTSELSSFLTFAPAGLILAGYHAITTKKKDPLSIALIAVELFCLYFLIIGVPAVVAKATLLFECNRMNIALGLADIILLFRGLSRAKAMPVPLAIVCTLVSAAFNMFLMLRFFPVPKLYLIVFIVLYLTLFYLVYRHQYDQPIRKVALVFSLSCLMFAVGAFVNPVQQGIQSATETTLVKALSEVPNASDDVYLVEGNWPYTNVPLLAGKTCLDSTQVYPNPEKWKAIDPTGQYHNIYNRFCHLSLNLITEPTSFALRAEDWVEIHFCIDDLAKYQVHYLLSQKDYSDLEGYKFTLLGTADDWHVYQITYPPAATPSGN